MVANDPRVAEVLSWFERRGTRKNRDGMARYGIVAKNVFGVSVEQVRALAKQLGRDHALTDPLWATGWYEARILCAFVGDPQQLTATQMDRWAKDFDNWAICDALCFHLFDRSPLAWRKCEQWCGKPAEFVKRAGFALIASVALHDKQAPDPPFLTALDWIERESGDARNFVKKGISWALRGIGHRNQRLHAAAMELSSRLAASTDPAARWIGRDALRDLTSAATKKRLEKLAKKAGSARAASGETATRKPGKQPTTRKRSAPSRKKF